MGMWQRMRGMLGFAAPVPPVESDSIDAPFDAESVRANGQPVVCIIAESGLADIDRNAFMIEPIGEDLCKIVGFELDYDVVFADRASLERRGYGGAGLWEIAHANTRPIMPIIPTAQELRESEGMTFDSDCLVPSMLAELDVWVRLSGELGGDLYVAPLSETSTWVGLAADGEPLDDVRFGARSDYAAIAAGGDPRHRAISPDVFRIGGGGWRIA